MARLLLSSLCLLSLAVPSCIIPVGPNWQDPPAVQNFAPEILDTNPAAGKIVTNPTFSITVTDPNVGDDLYVRWLADYPDFTGNTRILEISEMFTHSVDGQPLMPLVSWTVECIELATSLTQHQITVIVADRPFADPGPTNNLDAVDPDGLIATATWFLISSCQPPF